MNRSTRIATGSISLLFVRHGETESNAENRYMGHLDSPLSAKGIAQAAAVGARLTQADIQAIYTSDLGRAAATAGAIGDACDLEPVPDARLRERHAGVFQGLLSSEARERFPGYFAESATPTPSSSIPEGESALQLQARLVPLLEQVCERYEGQSVVIVTHGMVIRTLLWHFLECSYPAAFWARVDNTSLTTFRREQGCWILQGWNDTGHARNL